MSSDPRHDHLPIVRAFLEYLLDERHFSPYTARCYGVDLRQFVEHLGGCDLADLDMAVESAAYEQVLKSSGASGPGVQGTITGQIVEADVERIRGFLAVLADQSYSTATMARKIATLRSFHRWMHRISLVASNPMTLIRTPRQDKRLLRP